MATVWLETGLSLQFAAEQVAMTPAKRDAIVPWLSAVATALLGEADTVDNVVLRGEVEQAVNAATSTLVVISALPQCVILSSLPSRPNLSALCTPRWQRGARHRNASHRPSYTR